MVDIYTVVVDIVYVCSEYGYKMSLSKDIKSINKVYITDRLILKTLEEKDASLLFIYFSKNKNFLEPWESQRAMFFYSSAYMKHWIRKDNKQMLDGELFRLWIYKKQKPDIIIGSVGIANINIFKPQRVDKYVVDIKNHHLKNSIVKNCHLRSYQLKNNMLENDYIKLENDYIKLENDYIKNTAVENRKYIKATLGYRLDKDYKNQGYITEAILKMVQISFNDLKINRLEANVLTNNYPSLRVLEKCDFIKEKDFKDKILIGGKFQDYYRYVRNNDV